MPDKIQMPLGPQPVQPVTGRPGAANTTKVTGPSFQEVFQGVTSPKLKFSAHAERRLQTRGITLDEQKLNELMEAIDKVEAKGGKESLVLMDKIALIVSVKNRTVITAIDGESLKENVFTNIDSAIITS